MLRFVATKAKSWLALSARDSVSTDVGANTNPEGSHRYDTSALSSFKLRKRTVEPSQIVADEGSNVIDGFGTTVTQTDA
ncbi:MAG: hypothetical protein BWY47_00834 [Bacteroidetes bacterium ADurb.Bin302]|nr:MAG: hypothetical protein BWY47_00834 [Bacteroidetes bacterium ADurb.Bin302]